MRIFIDLFKALEKNYIKYWSIPILILTFFTFYCSNSKKSEEKVKQTEEIVKQKEEISYEVPKGAENWPSFRGINGSGLAKNQDLPLKWDISEGTNIHWTYSTEGLGLSSPVIWKDKVFLTTAVSQAGDHSLKVGLYGDIGSVQNEKSHVWKLICLNRITGKVLWSKDSYSGVPKIKRHPKSSHATSTAATDGKYVVAMFGSEGLYCYDFNGNLLWKKDLGILDAGFFRVPDAQWEYGSSPVIHKGLVILQCDIQKNSFITAIDIANGKTVWKTDRDDVPTWSTPAIYDGKDQTQIIVNGYKHIGSYDIKDGKAVWWMKGGGDIPVPTPVIGFNHVFITNSHGRMSPLYAIRLDAKGDISLKAKEKSNQFITWFEKRKGAYLPTPIIYGDYLYICRDNGILSCRDAKTGKEIYKKRIGGVFDSYSASPIAADGRIYFTSETGNVHIIKAGGTYKYLATNKFEASCLATPSISGNMLFVRTLGKLYAIGKGGKSKGVIVKKEEGKPVEKIDFDKVKKDGSIKDFEEIVKNSKAALSLISSVKYDILVEGHGENKSRVIKAKTTLLGYANRLPKYFKVELDYQGSNPQSSKKLSGGSDGNEFYIIDHLEKTFKRDIESNLLGSNFNTILQGVVNSFVSIVPMNIEKTAKKKTLKGIKNIDGVNCYEISFLFPQYGNYEIIWYFSIKSFLPKAKKTSYTMKNGKIAGFYSTISKMVINPKLSMESFKFSEPKEYKQIKNK